jgi:predicted nucleic acid-binding protein
MKTVVDTNILIDYLNGVEAAREELGRYTQAVISVITFVEVLVGVKSVEEEKPVRQFLARFEVRAVDAVVAERAVVLRRELRLKVPDAIIYATAGVENCPLVTRNVRDFGTDRVDVRVPYRL